MRNVYFDIPPEATISIRSFTYFVDDGEILYEYDDAHFIPGSNPFQAKQVSVSPPDIAQRQLRAMFTYPTSTRKRNQRIISRDSCGCREHHCDSCWCQCDDKNCNSLQPLSRDGGDEAEEGLSGESESEDEECDEDESEIEEVLVIRS
jgi:hypothetical protein